MKKPRNSSVTLNPVRFKSKVIVAGRKVNMKAKKRDNPVVISRLEFTEIIERLKDRELFPQKNKEAKKTLSRIKSWPLK
ncbi:hypothetical protein [Pedobacter heparinus]|uniref:hypothetical protein n=1 Tax=Pedobacter heparinus TaxID=984 RepID=UPI0029307875|nr:hypothetical protein [Pedobacter heparinus]